MVAADKIYQCLLDRVSDNTGSVDQIIIGLTWTLAKYRDQCGLAMSPGYLTRTLPWAGELCEMPLKDITQWIRSWNGFEASVAMASINAVLNQQSPILNNAHPLPGEGAGNLRVFEYFLPKIIGKKVVVVGRYPGLKIFEELVDLTVLERNPGESDLPDPACEFVIPEADWVFLSATSLINKTFPRLAELAKNANLVLMGPSLPWIEELSEFGVDYLAGVRVANSEQLVTTVAEGGGTRIFDGAVEYCLYDFTQKQMQITKSEIASVVQKRDSLKIQMENWYTSQQKGRFPGRQELLSIDEKLSYLDLRFKRLWDANEELREEEREKSI